MEYKKDIYIMIYTVGIFIAVIQMILLSIFTIPYLKSCKHIVLQKRFANVIIFIYVFQMLRQFSWIMLEIINILAIYNKDIKYISFECVSKIIRIFILNPCFMICIFLWIIQFWMNNYQIHFTQKALQNTWKSVINSQLEKNWFIRYKKSCGNLVVVCIITSISFIIIVGALTYFLYERGRKYYKYIIIGISLSITIMSCCVFYGIYRSIPIIHDNFFIYDELRLLSFTLIIIMILWLSWICLDTMDIIITMSDIYTESMIYTIYQIIFSFFQICALLISTCYIYRKVSPIIKKSKFKFKRKGSIEYLTQNNGYGSMYITTSKSQDIAPENNKIVSSYIEMTHTCETQNESRLYLDMLKDEKYFEEFVLYLSKDYCVSNVLAFIELIQFQKYIDEYIKNHQDYIKTHHNKLYEKCIFPESIPKSIIVFGSNGYIEPNGYIESDDGETSQEEARAARYSRRFLRQAKLKAFQLYDKYIKTDGDYKIDIEYNTKMNLDNWIENEYSWIHNNMVDIQDLLEIFQDAVQDLLEILCDSYQRFMKTNKYRKLKQSQS